MELFEQQYSGNPPSSVSWYASLNAVLAIGRLIFEDEIRLHSSSMNLCRGTEGALHVLSCLRNCYSVFTQLAFSCRDIMAVQALIGMVGLAFCDAPDISLTLI